MVHCGNGLFFTFFFNTVHKLLQNIWRPVYKRPSHISPHLIIYLSLYVCIYTKLKPNPSPYMAISNFFSYLNHSVDRVNASLTKNVTLNHVMFLHGTINSGCLPYQRSLKIYNISLILYNITPFFK